MALGRKYKKILEDNHFESSGTLEQALRRDEWDGARVLYAITNPEDTRIVYIGDTETGRNVRARLRAHLNDRSKMGLVENDSKLWIHFMVTEFKVLDDFEEEFGGLPELNKRKVQK